MDQVTDAGGDGQVAGLEGEAGLGSGAVVGAILGLAWAALLAAGTGLVGMPNPAFAFFELLTRLLPGDLVTAGLELMIGALQGLQVGDTSQLGKTLEGGLAYLSALVGLALLGGWHVRMRKTGGWVSNGTATGLVLGLASLLVQVPAGWGQPGPILGMAWLVLLGLLWGWALKRAVRWLERSQSARTDLSRRAVLARLAAGTLAVSGIGALLARLGADGKRSVPVGEVDFVLGPTPTPSPVTAGFNAVAGTRPEISSLEGFYRVDINLSFPLPREVARSARRAAQSAGLDEWPIDEHFVLVDGMVDGPRVFTLQELRDLTRVDKFVTLSCISNNVGGDLIDTQLFSGVRLRDVLGLAGLQPDAQDIKFTSADGYSESLPVASALDEDTLLTYAMGGRALTPGHGFPLRLFAPDRFGMKNPKWIVQIEAVPNDYRGYWETRGWSEQAIVKTTAVIDTVMPAGQGAVVVGGIAYAGARGIAAVEIRVDQGDWTRTSLNRPLSYLTWVAWRARVEAAPGSHQLAVRAVDKEGEVQTNAISDSYPSGATGYHSRTVEIPGPA